jgi:hypothetical protein
MKVYRPLPLILRINFLGALAIWWATSGVAQGTNINIWATDQTGSYPVVLGTIEWVLIGTAFGENFEEDYPGKESLENLFLQSVLRISPCNRPKVAVFSGGDSSDIVGMKKVMNKFLKSGNISSFDLKTVSTSAHLDFSLYGLVQYDVVVLDPPTCKGPDWQFIITEGSLHALARYLENGGRIVASAYLFVYWVAYPSGEKALYNKDLSALLFDGARPDLEEFSPKAIAKSALGEAETFLTLNTVISLTEPKARLFHSFWKLTLPAKEKE